MRRRLHARLGRRLRRGYSFLDLALAALGQPRLFLAAWRILAARKARGLESGLRLAEGRDGIEAAIPGVPVDREALRDGLAARCGVLLLDEGDAALRRGLAEVELLSALHWLIGAARGAILRIGGTPLSPTTPDFRSRALSAREIALDFIGPEGQPDTIILEPYFRHEAGKWISSNPHNTEARAIYDEGLESPGLTRVDDLLGAPSFDQLWRDREIDLVYTWVNHADPDWAALYQRFHAGHEGETSDDATSMTRFRAHDELRYSLRSVAENLPWVRQIHVLTNCAPPDWLKAGHPRVRWVRHEEVIPERYLPTFSSHVIESFLHHLPGLSEHFIYMNDDFFIARPLAKSFFFNENGATRALLEPYGKVLGPPVEGAPDYLNAARNGAALIRAAFGFAPTRLHRHAPYALRRDLLAEIEGRWQTELETTRTSRFRSVGDLSMASFLAHHYGLATGRSVIGCEKVVLVKSEDIRWRAQLRAAVADNPATICINEGGAVPPGRDWDNAVRAFMQDRWPRAAAWER